MNTLLKNIFPKEFFTRPEYFRALALGALYLGTLLAQLFSYEKFAGVVRGYALPGGEFVTILVAWLLPLLALASLPFMLSMKLGGRLYGVSRTAVVALPLFWLAISIWLVAVRAELANTGLFGATLEAPAGLWFVAFALLWLWASVLVVRELPRR